LHVQGENSIKNVTKGFNLNFIRSIFIDGKLLVMFDVEYCSSLKHTQAGPKKLWEGDNLFGINLMLGGGT
jgi:hypothetical protein